MSRLRPVRSLFVLMLLVSISSGLGAERVAVNTNLLYWLTTTPNIGIDMATGRHFSIAVSGGYNNTDLSWFGGGRSNDGVNSKLYHWALMPEMKWWLSMPHRGAYLGLHLLCGKYNAGGLLFPKFLKEHRYRGNAVGAGISYGCQWHVGGNWRVGVNVGLSWVRLDYKVYMCGACGANTGRRIRNLGIVTPVGVSLSYVIPSGGQHSSDEKSVEEYIAFALEESGSARLRDHLEATGPEDAASQGGPGADTVYTKSTSADTVRIRLRHDIDSPELSELETARLDAFLSALECRRITQVAVNGYASPEYDEDHNQILSARRARNVADRLIYIHDIPDQIVKVKGYGDDWEGLYEAAGDVRGVRAVLETYAAGADRKRALRALGNYSKIVSAFYPLLRHTEVIISVE